MRPHLRALALRLPLPELVAEGEHALLRARTGLLDHVREVVPSVDVHHQKGERVRPERLLGEPQQHDRVLAAAEQQHRTLELGPHLEHHLDRLGLQRAQMG